MSSNSILKLQVDDKQYEASLKNAQQGLTALQAALRNSGKSFADVDKQTEQYVRELGKMEATAKTTRGRIGEMSSAFVELSRIEKQLTDQERQSPVGKALTESLAQLKQRTIDAKSELQGLENQIKNVGEVKLPDTGGLFSGDKLSGMLQVFGGNLMTKAAGAVANLGSEMYGMVQQGIEMAKAGEGIRIAFERLGRGDILDGLREATHGTVTDLDLMKAAVKFNDFKLPLDELGTMLAFAQQKAKDTGQSVDYMVDSIVTGLGRKSLMILDNLGLSATEVRERMKETGDMTKAVGAIIREQMAKAGDYVETAADRAAQANVSLQNKMEELGRKFAPLEEASNNFWTSMKIGILDVVGGPLARLLNGLTEAGRLKNMLDDLNGGGNGKESQTERALRLLREYSGGGRGVDGKRDLYNRQMASYSSQEEKAWREVNRLRSQLDRINNRRGEDPAGYDQAEVDNLMRRMEAAENRAKAIQIMRANYQKGASDILNPKQAPTITTSGGSGGGGGKTATTTGIKDEFAEMEELVGLIPVAEQKVKDLQQQIRESWDEGEIEKLREDLKLAQAELDRLNGKAQKIDLNKIFPERSFTSQPISAGEQMVQSIRLDMAQSIQDADAQTLRTLLEAQIKNGIEGVDIPTDWITDQIFGEGVNISDEYWQNLQEQINEKLRDMGVDPIEIDFKTGKDKGNKDDKNDGKDPVKALKDFNSDLSQVTGGIGNIANGIQQLGIELPQGIQDAVSVLTGISSIITGITSILGLILVAQQTTAVASWTDAIIPFANGGIVPHAANGYYVPGNHYSNDVTPIMANAGELILNKAAQGNLVSQLEGSGMQNMKLDAVITGEQIRLVLNNNGRRTGRGEYVQTKSGRG